MYKLSTAKVKGKRVLVRVDFNVPLDKQGNILDDFKIVKALPTIKYLIKHKAKVILMSHLGDPAGQVVAGLKLDVIQERLMEYLDLSIVKAPDCIGAKITAWTQRMRPGEILLLENLRFRAAEEKNEEAFAKALSRLGDIYVNDAFAVTHRAHASVVNITKFLPAFAGLLLEEELAVLSKVMDKPERPFVALIGGAKIESKAGVIKSFLAKADHLILGGKIANSLLEAQGRYQSLTGLSAQEQAVIKEIPLTSDKLHLPVDFLVSFDPADKSFVKERSLADLESKELPLDIGPQSTDNFSKIIKEAKTIVWAGPFGLFENPLFAKGTQAMVKALTENEVAFKVAGGGETNEFINQHNLGEKFNHVSTGGGAMLEFLSGDKLPGIEALKYG